MERERREMGKRAKGRQSYSKKNEGLKSSRKWVHHETSGQDELGHPPPPPPSSWPPRTGG
uniref:Uncharacterized protein n=1 Tax=Cucumis melo TaxID=3656 RepID=A0A9I9CII9_CUCME